MGAYIKFDDSKNSWVAILDGVCIGECRADLPEEMQAAWIRRVISGEIPTIQEFPNV